MLRTKNFGVVWACWRRRAQVRRLVLEATDEYAGAIAQVLVEHEGLDPATAQVRSVALASLIQTVTDEFGQRVLAGEELASIATTITSILRVQIADLEWWWAAKQ